MSEPIPPEPFRLLPVRRSEQRSTPADRVCSGCLSGTCCTSEGPIYLTPFDILRLAAFFDVTPADFMRRFTQDRFDEDDGAVNRAAWVAHPESSFVTWLRRRTVRPASPCLFLKYTEDADSTVRRICSVHEARPLACREYYHDTCRTRWTGEMAVLEAHALEAVRDGVITAAAAELAWRESAPAAPRAPLSHHLRRHFWALARRALRPQEANEDGAAPPDPAAWQDPMPEKMNRLLGKKHLRLEERYGYVPHSEQLHAFTDGTAFSASAERARLLRIAEEPPRTDLFAGGDYPYQAAHRFLIGLAAPRRFPLLSAAAIEKRRRAVPETLLFARLPSADQPFTRRDAAGAALAGAQAVVRLASFLDVMENVLERRPPGLLESALLNALNGIPPGFHPGLDAVLGWCASPRPEAVAGGARRAAFPPSPVVRLAAQCVTGSERNRCAAIRALLARQSADGSWDADPAAGEAPDSQGAYYYRWLTATASAVRVLALAAGA